MLVQLLLNAQGLGSQKSMYLLQLLPAHPGEQIQIVPPPSLSLHSPLPLHVVGRHSAISEKGTDVATSGTFSCKCGYKTLTKRSY